jgi:hypothetical protein
MSATYQMSLRGCGRAQGVVMVGSLLEAGSCLDLAIQELDWLSGIVTAGEVFFFLVRLFSGL